MQFPFLTHLGPDSVQIFRTCFTEIRVPVWNNVSMMGCLWAIMGSMLDFTREIWVQLITQPWHPLADLSCSFILSVHHCLHKVPKWQTAIIFVWGVLWIDFWCICPSKKINSTLLPNKMNHCCQKGHQKLHNLSSHICYNLPYRTEMGMGTHVCFSEIPGRMVQKCNK